VARQGAREHVMSNTPTSKGAQPHRPSESNPHRPHRTNSGSNSTTIRIVKGEIARMTDAAEAALIAAADAAPIMVRAGRLVQPIVDRLAASDGRTTEVTLLKPLSTANIIYLLNKHAAGFEQYDKRSKKWFTVDPPAAVATQLLETNQWQFPKVAGVIAAPTLRPDGTILDQPGYDPATQLWCAPDSKLVMPPRIEDPTRRQAEQALKLLEDAIINFPFVTDVDRSVGLSALLTPAARSLRCRADDPAARTGRRHRQKFFQRPDLDHCQGATLSGDHQLQVS
jgi:putative DNA primase/helicase